MRKFSIPQAPLHIQTKDELAYNMRSLELDIQIDPDATESKAELAKYHAEIKRRQEAGRKDRMEVALWKTLVLQAIQMNHATTDAEGDDPNWRDKLPHSFDDIEPTLMNKYALIGLAQVAYCEGLKAANSKE